MARSNSRTLLRTAFLIVIFAMIMMIITRCQDLSGSKKIKPVPVPEFTQSGAEAWINSQPLGVKDLKGKVTLMDIWTFDCWNCYRSFPWLKKTEHHFKDDLQVIGIHTPEFAHEKIRNNVINKTKEFGLTHAVMMDNDFGYWKALGNRYWPAFYIIDRKGLIRARFTGETHPGDRNARAMEALIARLIKEK